VQAIELLRSCCQVNVQSTWLYNEADLANADITLSQLSVWTPVELNEKKTYCLGWGAKSAMVGAKINSSPKFTFFSFNWFMFAFGTDLVGGFCPGLC
jgi:hypothetical protein